MATTFSSMAKTIGCIVDEIHEAKQTGMFWIVLAPARHLVAPLKSC
jgi:hypothetical protein